MAKSKSLVTIPSQSKKIKSDQINDLSSTIVDVVNKKFKDIPHAMGLMSEMKIIGERVSTGADMLDLAISNVPYGGIPYSSIVEMSALPGVGKSLLAAHILVETQKQNGIAVLYDTEKAVGIGTIPFYEAVGLDLSKTVYSNRLRALEDVFLSMENLIERYIAADTNQKMTIVVDSIMGATTHIELEADYEKSGYATAKSIVLSQAMRKIPSLIVGRNIIVVFINQLKENIGAVGFGADPYKTTGGTSIAFASDLRLRMKKVKTLAVNGSEYGSRVEVKVVKNRFGPPGRRVLLDIYFDSGVDNYGSWLQCMKDLGLLKQSGAYYTYDYITDTSKEPIQFQSKEFGKLLKENPALKSQIYDKIADKVIMRYRIDEDFGIDDVREVEESDID